MSTRATPRVFLLIAVPLLLAAAACQTKNGSGSTPGSTPGSTAGPAVGTPASVPVDLPTSRLDQAGDVNSMQNANQKAVSGGDVYVNGLYERPFNADTMDKYFAYLDIVNLQGYKDDTWGYAQISLAGKDPNGKLPGEYAVELDLNKDGRGDWLILATSVSSTDWSRTGVQAYKDPDGDVGGNIPMVADNNPQGGDGYETLVFDQGKGTLSDGAFARIDPSDAQTVDIAFKLAMIGDPPSYAMGGWAGSKIDPAMFDYNDHMTHPQAGSPNRGDTIYPIKQLAESDNTCRLAIGFAPSSAVPGLCSGPNQASKDSGSGGSCRTVTGAPCVTLNPVPIGPVQPAP